MTTYPTARGLAGILRRIGAGCYDLLLVTGLLMGAVLVVTLATRSSGPEAGLAASPYRLSLQLVDLIVIYAYFGFSWTRAGETLGMKAWGLRLVTVEGGRPGWGRALVRLAIALPLWLAPGAALLYYMRRGASGPVAALAVLPLLASLAAAWRDGVSLHDRLSGTRVLRVPRDAPVPAAGRAAG